MLSKRVKVIINIITFIALAALIYFSWPQITEGLKEIGGAKWSMILLMIPAQILNFYAVGAIYRSFFKADDINISKKLSLKVALELNFVNHVFPSGGVAGFSYLGYRFKARGIPVAKTTLAQAVRFALTFISFLIILFIGLFLLSFGQSGGVALFIGLTITLMIIFGTLVGVFIISSEKRIKAFVAFLPRLINMVFRGFTKKNLLNIDRIEVLLSELHKDYAFMAKDWRRLKTPFLWALVVNLTEITTIYLAYLALGQPINPGAVILAYAVASFAGLIAILPGGIGVYEALMTATLTSTGVPKALALSATLIYRVFTMVVFVPIGFVLYQLALKRGDAKKVKDARSGTSI